jgi:hypothetical protein
MLSKQQLCEVSMAIGKEIKVVLTLDDAGFSVKTKSAADAVKVLQAGFEGVGKTATTLESSVSDLAESMGEFGAGFKSTTKILEQISAQLEGFGAKLTSVGKKAEEASGGLDSFDESLKPVSGSIGKVSKETSTLATILTDTKNRLNAARNGFAEFDNAQKKSAATANMSAKEFAKSRIAALEAEVQNDNRILAARGKLHAELRALEGNTKARAMQQQMGALGRNDAGKFVKKTGSNEEAAQLAAQAAGIGAVVAKTEQEIIALRVVRDARVQSIGVIKEEAAAAEAAAIAGIANAKAAAAAIKATSAQAKIVAAEQRAANQRIADEQRSQFEQQRAHAQSIAQMWKSMAQMYVGAKIEKGVATGVSQADQMDRQKVLVSALNLPKDQEEGIYGDAKTMSNSLKYLTTLDAIKARMSAIASLGANNADVIGKTLTTAVTASKNMETLGLSHSDQESTIRNMYGVTEMRQQTSDPAAMNRTFEILQKITTGTAGKIQTQDIETLMRTLGTGSSQLSDHGLVNLAGVADQFKVSGGEGGGAGAGGVAKVGTAFKMLQAYASGKGLSGEAVKEFAGADVLDTGGLDMKKDDAHVLKDAKHAGFKDSQLWMTDPISAVQKIMPQIIEYTQKNKEKFYQGRDTNDQQAQMTAVTMYLQRLGITQTAATAMIVAGDPRSKKRLDDQSKTIEGSKGTKEVNDALGETAGRKWEVAKAQMMEIAGVAGQTLLPALKSILTEFNSVLESIQKFAEQNPAIVQFATMAAVIGGAALSLKGFIGMFGAVGSFSTVLRALASGGAAAGVAMEKTAKSGSLLSRTFGAGVRENSIWNTSLTATSTKLNELNPGYATVSESVKALGSKVGMSAPIFGQAGKAMSDFAGVVAGAGSKIIGIASKIGTAFLDIIPIIGELAMFYQLLDWVANLEVGGAKIIDWAISFGQRFYDTIAEAMSRTQQLLSDKSSKFAIVTAAFAPVAVIGNAAVNALGLSSKEDADKARYDSELESRRGRKASGTETDADKAKDDAGTWDQRQAEIKRQAKEDKERSNSEYHIVHDHDTSPAKIKPDANSQRVANAAEGDGSKGKRAENQDPLTAALANASAKVDEQQVKLQSILRGGEKNADLEAEAAAVIEGKRKAGEFNRTVKDAKGNEKSVMPGANDPRIQSLIKQTAQEMLLAEQLKAVGFANERVAAAQDETDFAMDRLNEGNLSKQTDAFRALTRELDRAEQRLGAGAKAFDTWGRQKDQALLKQAIADGANQAANDKQNEKPDTHGMTHDEAIVAEQTAANQKVNDLLDARENTINDALSTTIANLKENLNEQLALVQGESAARLAITKKTNSDIEAATKSTTAVLEAIDADRTNNEKQQAKELKKALETPMDKLAEQWKDTQQQLQGLQDQWANGFVSLLETTMRKGESRMKQFKDNVLGYMKSVLTGIMDVAIKKSMGDSLKTVIDSATAGLQSEFASLFGSSAGNGGVGLTGSNVPKTSTMTQAGDYGMNATASSASDAAGATSEASATTAVTTAMTTLSTSGIAPLVTGFESLTTTGITPLMEAAQECATALRQAATSAGGSGGGAGGIGGLFGGGAGAGGGASTSLDALNGAGSTVVGLANGGLMTQWGMAPLRKYAGGGIANSPQVAVYGEAGPEAFVPLPDGRSIPVTISGSGDSSGSGTSAAASPPITVNVINQSGTQVAAQQQGPSSISAGQMILNVVLTAASQPGSFRSGMQTALTSPSSSSTKPA